MSYPIAKKMDDDGRKSIRMAVRRLFNSMYWMKFGKFRGWTDDEILTEYSDIIEYIQNRFKERYK